MALHFSSLPPEMKKATQAQSRRRVTRTPERMAELRAGLKISLENPHLETKTIAAEGLNAWLAAGDAPKSGR